MNLNPPDARLDDPLSGEGDPAVSGPTATVTGSPDPAIDGIDSMKKGRLMTLSNGISLLRLLMTLPTVLAIIYHQKTLAVLLFFAAAGTDYLDGWFARHRGEVSETGRIIDPLADKIFVGTIVFVMLLVGIVPLWLVVLVLGRDLLILIGGIVVQRKTGEVLPSNWTGKWAVGILSIALLLLYLDVPSTVTIPVIAAAVLLLLLSIVQYSMRMIAHLKGETGKAGVGP